MLVSVVDVDSCLPIAVKDEKKGGKLPEEDQQAVTDAVNAAIEWIEASPDAEKDEYDSKYAEVEKVVQPVSL